ncbi:hypothetical protein KIPB_010847, partial [Kipferlia bialata]|eukprot:g10847.t1
MRRQRRERDHAERLSARDEVGGPLFRCLVQMLLVVEKLLCYEPDSDLLGTVLKLTHSCLQYSGHLHLGKGGTHCTWSPETALSTEECCVLAGCVARLSKRLAPETSIDRYIYAPRWEEVLISLLEVPGTYCRMCQRGGCSGSHIRCKREGNIDPSAAATRIAQVIWESGVMADAPQRMTPTTMLLYSLLYNALGADIEWPAHVLEVTGFAVCYSLAARAGVDLPAGARLLLPSFIPPTKARYTQTVSPPSDYTLRSYRHADIVSLPLSTVEGWGNLLTGVVRAGARDPSLLTDILPVMENVMSPFVVCLSDELVVALSDLVERVATGIRTDAADTSELDLVIQLAAAIVRVEAEYHRQETYTVSQETIYRATEGYRRRACTSAMVDAGLVGLIHTWMVAVSDGSSCDTSLADTASACASVLDIITQDTECRVQLRQCTQAEECLAEDFNRIWALVSDDCNTVLQIVEDRLAYRNSPYKRGVFEYPWSGWEIEQAICGKNGADFLWRLSSRVENWGNDYTRRSPARILCLSDSDNLRMVIHEEELLDRCRRVIGDDYSYNDPRHALVSAFRDEMLAEMRRQQYEDTDNVIFESEAPLLDFLMGLFRPATEPDLRLAAYRFVTAVMPHALCLSMTQRVGYMEYDETKPNSTLDQFIRKGYNEVVLPMAGEMLPEADMSEDDLFDQTSNWARGISYVHNIFSWPA